MIFLVIIFALASVSCEAKPAPVLFEVRGTDQALFGAGREAVQGKLNFPRSKKIEYRFNAPPEFFSPSSMVVEYQLSSAAVRPVLEAEGASWVLPSSGADVYHYAIPVDVFFPQRFSVALSDGALEILSIEFTGRWFGFYRRQNSAGSHLYVSPFVSRTENSGWALELPAGLNPPAGLFPALSVSLPPAPQNGEFVITAGGRRFGFSPRLEKIGLPAGSITPNDVSLVMEKSAVDFFYLAYAPLPVFPSPITADPGMVLAWPQENWRNARYEVFRWQDFPSLLIFDFADYAVQDRMLKRLAFFVEKQGFRGRLAPDSEIAELHGWNAHDYRAQDLARFFQLARETGFSLLAEERELQQILLDNNIICDYGGIIAEGQGGIISVSRESADYLRFRFMAHEGFHGIFFIDEDFRDFCRDRWRQLPAQARRFIVSYFDYQRYDTADEYLLINEFMAHILQQPVSQAGIYFGQTLPARIEETPWRRAHLPEKDPDTAMWPSLAAAFTREAEAFSAYVGGRWGLAAGRVHQITVK